ncbi:MAG: hypothetical protein CL933_26340 [Deltaproteobacteria bacterium]|nr:hypothetical protein [Deltaproteobacteria bacterium]
MSFPVGTRTCVHCGGRTGPSGQLIHDEGFVFSDGSHGTDSPRSAPLSGALQDDDALEPVAASPFSLGDASSGGAAADDRDLEASDEPRSVVRSLVRSLGGVVWVILLIGFSLARSCGD